MPDTAPSTTGHYLAEGYAAGYVGGADGKWLTILGSAHRSSDVVHRTRAEAEAWRDARPNARPMVIRRVRRTPHPGVTVTGEAFRVIGE